MLYQIYGGGITSLDRSRMTGGTGNTGINVAAALGGRIDTSKTTFYSNNSDDEISSGNLSGFLFTRKYGGAAAFSMGFYIKPIVESVKSGGKFVDTLNLGKSIRLDLTLLKASFKPLSKKMELGIDMTDFSMSYFSIRKFFTALFKKDKTGGILFATILEDYMYLKDIILISKKQWNDVFDLLIDKGYHELANDLKESKKSWTKMCKDSDSSLQPDRLRDRIKNITGVDVKIPYKLWETTRFLMYTGYIESEWLVDLIESEKSNGNIDAALELKKYGKNGRKKYKQMCRKLTDGNLRPVLCVEDFAIMESGSNDSEVPF